MYKLPIGIRVPEDNEYPSNSDIAEINRNRNAANIVSGYKLYKVKGEKYSYCAEINIDSDKIWDVFCELARELMGNSSYGIIGFKEEEPNLSKFTKTDKIIKIFNTYKFELTNDGFLEFGIATYDDKSLNEVFVTSFKYFKVWTSDREILVRTLKKFGINKIRNLEFIDDYPVISEALDCDSASGIKNDSEVLDSILQQFKEI